MRGRSKKTDSNDKLLDVLKVIKSYLFRKLSIKDNAEPTRTIEGIERDIEFKGFNLWILFFSIIVCSIGLNVNSTAVVIGAMLISPLMGPIMGMGLAIGINDWEMLRKSIKNLLTATSVAIAASTLYFLLSPLSDASTELAAHTRPTLLDVFVAFFGGLSGILAGSRKEKNNVIPGVAIATALMPPLCTAGYGIATLQPTYFFGAFYLFLINTFFIGVSTTLVVRYLKFPVKHLVNKRLEMKGRRYVIITALAVMIPSTFLFYGVVKETLFLRRANAFVHEVVRYEGTDIIKRDLVITDSINSINLVMLGQENIPQKVIKEWNRKLNDYNLSGTRLRIIQSADGSQEQNEALLNMFSESQREMMTKDQEIRLLESQLSLYQKSDLPKNLIKEIQVQYPDISNIRLGRVIESNFLQTDTVLIAIITWRKGMGQSKMETEGQKVKNWLNLRLENAKVQIENRIARDEILPMDVGPKKDD